MQSRKLRKLLNDTGYAVHFRDGKVCVGSPMCSELITVDSKTMKIKYALDTFREGRKSISSEELEFIWDTLMELIKTGELKTIIENDDPIDGMFPVYCCEDGKIEKKYADVFGWPHSTHDGTLMYENTFFKTEREAIEDGIKDMIAAVEMETRHMAQKAEELHEAKQGLQKYTDYLNNLKALLQSPA